MFHVLEQITLPQVRMAGPRAVATHSKLRSVLSEEADLGITKGLLEVQLRGMRVKVGLSAVPWDNGVHL